MFQMGLFPHYPQNGSQRNVDSTLEKRIFGLDTLISEFHSFLQNAVLEQCFISFTQTCSSFTNFAIGFASAKVMARFATSSASPKQLFHHPITHLCAKLELLIPQTTEIGILKFWMQQELQVTILQKDFSSIGYQRSLWT